MNVNVKRQVSVVVSRVEECTRVNGGDDVAEGAM